MKTPTILLLNVFLLSATLCHGDDTCRFGLGHTYGSGTCYSREAEALRRVASAKTICNSANSEVQWRKDRKEPSWAWSSLRSGGSAAIRGFRVETCDRADLVVKYVYDDTSETVTINVTDAESGATVFEESRQVSDLQSDAVRMANHWHEMVAQARAAALANKNAAEQAERERAQREWLENHSRQCQAEFDSLKQNIVDYVQVQHVALPKTIQDQIATHNKTCTNTISPQIVEEKLKAESEAKAAQERAESEAKAAQERAARERTVREQSAALLQKSKGEALSAYRQRITESPFVPPVEGWTHVAGLGTDRYYIILPGTGLDSNCHFALNGSRPALDCVGKAGRNDYVSVSNNGRIYLLKAKAIKSGEHSSTVKDGGSTLCLRDAGCHQVLAEVRREVIELPDLLQVSAPAGLNAVYSNGDITFTYPQNWKAEERKNKDNVVYQVSVAPPEAHLATWVTHGIFTGHAIKMSSETPATLDGAYAQFINYQRQRGYVIADAGATMPVGDSDGKVARYTTSSVFKAGESGWIAVVKDMNDGYYWVMMFYPTNDDSRRYTQTFTDILKSFRFKK